MKVQLSRNARKYISIAVTLGFVVLALLFFGSVIPAAVSAQATATPTNTSTPTNTPTLTPTALATGQANPQAGGFLQYLICGNYSYGQITPGACIQIYNGSDVEGFSAAGRRTYYMDAETGDVTLYGRLAQGPLGIKCVRGQQSFIGSATVVAATPQAAGISTPMFVQHSLAQDATGDGNFVTHTNSAGVVTFKVWNSALTPAAATTTTAVDYEICGN